MEIKLKQSEVENAVNQFNQGQQQIIERHKREI